jgi:hypothetical protein
MNSHMNSHMDSHVGSRAGTSSLIQFDSHIADSCTGRDTHYHVNDTYSTVISYAYTGKNTHARPSICIVESNPSASG